MDYGINLPYKMESRDDIVRMLFCSFTAEAERDAAVSAMRMEPISYMGQSIWVAPSMPLQSRMSQSFLFGLKRLLVSWGFRKQSIKVDTDDMSMHVENKIVCTASCTTNKLVLNWEDRWKKIGKNCIPMLSSSGFWKYVGRNCYEALHLRARAMLLID